MTLVARVTRRARIYQRLARDAPDDDRVQQLIAAGGAVVAVLAQQLAAGSITPPQFVERATAALAERLQEAAALGAGDALDPEAIDALLADRAGYLDGFAADVASGGLSVGELASRAALWGGLAWTAWQLGQGQRAQVAGQTSVHFHLDPAATHCQDCLDRAEGGPYPFTAVPSWPGDGATACSGNDRCWVTFSGAGDSSDADADTTDMEGDE